MLGLSRGAPGAGDTGRMSLSPEYAVYLAGVAQDAIDSVGVAGPLRAALVVFSPHTLAGEVYCNADAPQLVVALRSVLARLESGALVRLPVTDGVRWMDVDSGGR